MTIPDELVQAAAEAVEASLDEHVKALRLQHWPRDILAKGLAEIALRAAFAKLAECEAAVEAVRKEAVRRSGPLGDAKDFSDGADAALAALAREFGGQE